MSKHITHDFVRKYEKRRKNIFVESILSTTLIKSMKTVITN